MIALFLATFEFAMLITNKNKKLSLIVTMLITFSPLVHWWFAVNNLVEMIVFAEIAIVLIDKYLLESNFKKRIFLSSMVMLCAGNYMFCTYPAWLVPTTYVFLPSLIWVFYKNRKDIKFTKKDILVLVLEVLILTGLVLRIFVKSIDAINLISNTAYPGKRVSTGGEIESLIQLITGNINLITPYTNKYENPCEIALVMDFFPITILLLIFSIIKNKTKDFLLYFMLGISIFLTIYCIIGFPEIIAKITFMSLSVSNRTKGVIGIINVFILARLLAINKENVFSVKLSAILSIIISLSIGEYIRYCYKEYFDIWQFIAIDVLTAIIYFCVLQAKNKKIETLLVICISIFSIVSVFGINPLRVGTPIYKNELGQAIEKINDNDPGTWVTMGISGNFLLPFGANSLTCVHTYPNLGLWQVLDPEGDFEEEYNRYAEVILGITNDENVYFNAITLDALQVFSSIDNLYKINVKYICTNANYDNKEVDTSLHKLEKIDCKEGFNIYKIVDI